MAFIHFCFVHFTTVGRREKKLDGLLAASLQVFRERTSEGKNDLTRMRNALPALPHFHDHSHFRFSHA